MNLQTTRAVLAVAAAVLASGAWGHAQIIQDGSFEAAGYSNKQDIKFPNTFTVNGWTFGSVDSTNNTIVGTEKWGTPGSDGVTTEHHIEMITNNPSSQGHVYLETTMTGLITGQDYILSFDAERKGAIGIMGVFFDGSSTATASYTLGTSYTTQTIQFTATGTSELLRFQDNSSLAGSSNWNLDAVSVVSATPEVNSIVAVTLLVVGIGCVERRRIRRAGKP